MKLRKVHSKLSLKLMFQRPKRISFPPTLNRRLGFTLIELLIVVVILSTLAAVVVPSFNSTAGSSRDSVVLQNLRIVQSAIDRYEASHGFYPGPSNWGTTCPGFKNSLRASNDGELLRNRLTMYTNSVGVVCNTRTDRKGENYPLGPYIHKQIPFNPVNRSNLVLVSNLDSASPVPSYGWRYNNDIGIFPAMPD